MTEYYTHRRDEVDPVDVEQTMAEYRARRRADYIREGKEHHLKPWVPPMPRGTYYRVSSTTGQDALAIALSRYPEIARIYFGKLGGGQIIAGEVKGFREESEVYEHLERIGWGATKG